MTEKIIIVDFGSQFTQLIARRVREIGVYSEVIPSHNAKNISSQVSAIILSGGPNSVHDEDLYDQCNDTIKHVLHLNSEYNTPILGICFGKQLICKHFGSQIISQHQPEFGKAELTIQQSSQLINQSDSLTWTSEKTVTVWMSHSDSATSLPEGFKQVASTDRCKFAIIANDERKIYGLQFHPEVSHTQDGPELLENFINIAQCKKDWSMQSFIEYEQENIKKTVGTKKVIAC